MADEDSLSQGQGPDDPPAPAPSNIRSESLRVFRAGLTHGEDAVDLATWAGSVRAQSGIAPRVRVGRSKWFNLLWLLPIGFLLLIIALAVAKELRGLPSVAAFIRKYPGTVAPPNGKLGFPIWVGWQHFRPRNIPDQDGRTGRVLSIR